VTAYRFPTGRNIEGPNQVYARMNQDESFSQQRTLLGTIGSTVLFGDFLVVPVEQTFLYVQPVYVRAEQEASLPELKFVLLVNGSGGEVAFGTTLDQALDAAIGTDEEAPPEEPEQPEEPGEPGEPVGPVDQQIQALLQEALDLFMQADSALAAGDLGEYQQLIEQAQERIADAQALAAGEGGDAGTPSPSPSG
jgi:uncharacterized membrane protein (UPF0182 family)